MGSFLVMMGFDALLIHSYASSLLYDLIGRGALVTPSPSTTDWRPWVVITLTFVLAIFGSIFQFRVSARKWDHAKGTAPKGYKPLLIQDW